jgi:hypothetical protein
MAADIDGIAERCDADEFLNRSSQSVEYSRVPTDWQARALPNRFQRSTAIM